MLEYPGSHTHPPPLSMHFPQRSSTGPPFTKMVVFVTILAAVASAAETESIDIITPDIPRNVEWTIGDTADQDSLDDEHAFGILRWRSWVSAGFTANAHGNRTGYGNAPLPWNEIADGPVLSQLWLHAEKPLDLEQRACDWGFVVDYVFGTDGPKNQAVGDQGWDFGWNSSRDYGSAIPQLYAQVGIERLRCIAGNFITPLGFETNQGIDNFFYTHNYAFGYGVPGIHSGVLATYQAGEHLHINLGWTAGWDGGWSNHLDASTFLGGLSWEPSEVWSLTYHLTAGDWGDGTAAGDAEGVAGAIYSHAIVFACDITSRLSCVLENTLGNNAGLGPDNNRWYSLTNYLFYEFNDRWSLGGRCDWFLDEDGARIGVNGAGAGDYYAATLGLNWQPRRAICVRPEVRWDWFSGDGRPFDSRDGGQSGTDVHQFTTSLDVILSF